LLQKEQRHTHTHTHTQSLEVAGGCLELGGEVNQGLQVIGQELLEELVLEVAIVVKLGVAIGHDDLGLVDSGQASEYLLLA